MEHQYSSSEVLSLLQHLDVDSDSIEQVKNIMNKFEYHRIISSLIVPKGSIVLRARPNNNTETFKAVEQLTYPRKEYCTKHQRANLKGHPVFYCSIQILGDGKIYDALAGMLFEASDFARQNTINGRQCITYSLWEVKEEFRVFYFPFEDTSYMNCPKEISMLNQKYCKEYYELLGENILDDSLLKFLVSKISRISKSEDDYYIIANVIHYILANDKYFDGIMYLSTRMNGYTVNLALTPYAADNYLTLKGVHLFGLEKHNGNMILIPIADGKFDGEIIKYQATAKAKRIWAAH